MARARMAALAAMVLILALGATALAAPAAVAPGRVSAEAVVAWPTSTGLLVAEVVTGDASASDEYVELTNVASLPMDLAGLEVAYVTSTGSTVTRKASWATSLLLGPGRHLLIANASGTYAAGADATYSGGFAATGGAIVLRPIGGQPIDAATWGDATSAFVEGAPAPAPAAGSSIERRPGGPAGSSVDTNDNAADFVANAAPTAQNLAAPPAPAPSPSPSPSAGPSTLPSSSPSPTPTPTTVPTATPAPTASPSPTATPTVAPTATPLASPTTTPAATPPPTAQPIATPSPTATASPSPTASPGPSDAPLTVAAARAAAGGTVVFVRGVVIAEPGRLGTPPLLAMADQTGGVAVKLPDGVPGPARGTLVEVRGMLADPYGQLEIRPGTGGLASIGSGTPPTPIARQAGSIGEADEGRLVRVAGTIDASAGKSTSHDISFSITGSDGGSLRILADASSGLDAGLFRKGATVTLTGVVGQRASRKGALDGYRLWLRDRADVAITAQPSPTATPRGGATPTPKPGNGSSGPGAISIRNALLRDGTRVTVEGTVTVGTALLDSSGRRTIVEDDTAAIEVYLAAPDPTLKAGARVRATGTVGQAWGAPRLRADQIRVVGSRRPSVHAIRSAPTAALEWRLVKVSGSIAEVHRNGDRWTADLQVGAARVLIGGLAGSGIASTDLVEGRSASITGIVKRPYPTATDQRFAIVPRQRADLVLGRAAPVAAGSQAPGSTLAPGSTVQASGALGPDAAITGLTAATATDIDLVDLGAHTGQRVRVGGLVRAIETDGVRLDDGTAEARLVLEGDAAALVGTMLVGDALNATGLPELRGEPVLVVTTPDGIELVGDLGDAANVGSEAATGDAAAVSEAVATLQAPMRAVAAPGLGLDSFSTGIGTLVLLAISSVGVALARRQRAQRRFRARILARLETIGRGAQAPVAGPDPGPEQPPSAPIGAGTGVELGGNVRGSA